MHIFIQFISLTLIYFAFLFIAKERDTKTCMNNTTIQQYQMYIKTKKQANTCANSKNQNRNKNNG